MYRLGVVSFLNARPLIAGLEQVADVAPVHDVPARLPVLLAEQRVDAALLPIVDLLRNPGRYRVVSDACIGCDGETLTVRVFAQQPPESLNMLRVDQDSHTSVALAQVLWPRLFGRELEVCPLTADGRPLNNGEGLLLIGDKVVSPDRAQFAYEVDLGSAWREYTGLPFVFAVWAVSRTDRRQEGRDEWQARLGRLLSAARDRGERQAARIAATFGPQHGWPVALAERYLTRCLRYRLDERSRAGAELFGRLCVAAALAPPEARIDWPAEPLPKQAS